MKNPLLALTTTNAKTWKFRQCCKTDKPCFFLEHGGPLLSPVFFFFLQYVSVVKRFFTTPQNLKAVHQRERESTSSLNYIFYYYFQKGEDVKCKKKKNAKSKLSLSLNQYSILKCSQNKNKQTQKYFSSHIELRNKKK